MSDETTVSLYLDLEKGEVADIEVVARAALAFSAAIKSLARDLAPEAEIRVELLSGTEGSLSLNSVIRGMGMLVTKERLAQIAVGIVIYFGMRTVDYTYDALLDYLTKTAPAEAVELSDADVQRIAKALRDEGTQVQLKQVFKEVERDPSIRGVGATQSAGRIPAVIVPRSEFQERVGVTTVAEAVQRRTVAQRMTVTLVSPVLVAGVRRWKFKGPTGQEFGAPVKDDAFIESVLSGTTAVPMVAGILMDVEVEADEDFEDGVWVPDTFVVVRVYGLRSPPPPARQASIFD